MEEIRLLFQRFDCDNPFLLSGYTNKNWQNIFNFIIFFQNIIIPNEYIFNILNFNNPKNTVLITNENIQQFLKSDFKTTWQHTFLKYYDSLCKQYKSPEIYFRYICITLLIYQYNNNVNVNIQLQNDMLLTDQDKKFRAHFYYFFQWYIILSILYKFNDLELLNNPLRESILECQQNIFDINKDFFDNQFKRGEMNLIDIGSDSYYLKLKNNFNSFYYDIFANFHWGNRSNYFHILNEWNRLGSINIISLSSGNASTEINFILYLLIYLKIKVNTLYLCDHDRELLESNSNIDCLKKTQLVNNVIVCYNILDLYNTIDDNNQLQLEFSPFLGRKTLNRGQVWFKIQNLSLSLGKIVGSEQFLYFSFPVLEIINVNKMFKINLSIINNDDKPVNNNLYVLMKPSATVFNDDKHVNYLVTLVEIRKDQFTFKIDDMLYIAYIVGNNILLENNIPINSTIKLKINGTFQIMDTLNYHTIRNLISEKTTTPFIKFLIWDKQLSKNGYRIDGGPNSHYKYRFSEN